MKFCKVCGTELKETMKFCPRCGKKCEESPEIPVNMKEDTKKGDKLKLKRKPSRLPVGIAVVCFGVILIAGILIYRWYMGAEERAITDAVINYENVNDTLVEMTASESYAQMETYEKAEQVLEALHQLENNGEIISDSIEYDETTQIITYEYINGSYGGVMLEEFAEGISGVGMDLYETSYNYDAKTVENWPAVPAFNSASYPYEEQNISAIMMYGLGQGYETYLEFSNLEKTGWDQVHLATTLDDDCTTSDFRTELSGHDLIIIQEHGVIYNNNPIIVLQETVTFSDALATIGGLAYTFEDELYLEDFQKNRIAILLINQEFHTCLLPEFFTDYYGDNQLSDAIVWIGCCNGYRNDSLVKAFADCGAKSVIACTETIGATYNYLMQDAVIYMLLYGNTVEESLDCAKTVWGENDKIFKETYSDQIDYDPSEIRIYNGSETTLVTLTEEAAASVPTKIDYNNLVSDAYYEAYEDENGSYEWRVPRINLNSTDVDAANSEIWEYAYINGVEANHEAINQNNAFVEYCTIEYNWAVNDDVLSLWIHTGTMSNAWDDYLVYNFNISTGEKLSRDELLQNYGITLDRYTELAEQVLGSSFWSGWDPSNKNFGNQSFADLFNEQLLKTVSDDNIAQSYPYINEKGQLCMVARIYSMAGAEYYWKALNMIDFELSPYYASEASDGTSDGASNGTSDGASNGTSDGASNGTSDGASNGASDGASNGASEINHTIYISEEEAYQIACEYWNYSEGDVSEETDGKLYLVYDGLLEESDGNHYYAFRLRWWVSENNRMSTVDTLYINAETGECSYNI